MLFLSFSLLGCGECIISGEKVCRPDGATVIQANKRVVLNKFGRDWSQYKKAIKDQTPTPNTLYFLSSDDDGRVKVEILPKNVLKRPNILNRTAYFYDEIEMLIDENNDCVKTIIYKVLEMPIAVGSKTFNEKDYLFSFNEK